jgi:GNAT superfamily N-acetyltransferase
MAESMNTLCIRLATLADVDTVAPLFDAYRQFYEQAPNLALAKDFIRDRLQKHESVVLLAFKGSDKDIGELVGFCQLYPTFCSVEAKPIYALYDLFVKPQARRLGVGHALLKAAEQQARDSGMSRMDPLKPTSLRKRLTSHWAGSAMKFFTLTTSRWVDEARRFGWVFFF